VDDALHPDRVLIGTRADDDYARGVMNDLYSGYPQEVIVHTNIWSSELAKIANNAFLSTKITQINALASLCDLSGADVTEVAHAAGMDRRIGQRFMQAGIGWGGSCFGKDLRALIYLLRHHGLENEAAFYQAAHDLNYSLRERFVRKMHDCMCSLPQKGVACLGFSFKPNTDDIRDAPAIDIVRMLVQEGSQVNLVDPASAHKAKEMFNVSVHEDVYSASNGAHAIVLLTEWDCFRKINFSRCAAAMRKPAWVFDGRNIYDPAEVTAAGLNYYGVGRGVHRAQRTKTA